MHSSGAAAVSSFDRELPQFRRGANVKGGGRGVRTPRVM